MYVVSEMIGVDHDADDASLNLSYGPPSGGSSHASSIVDVVVEITLKFTGMPSVSNSTALLEGLVPALFFAVTVTLYSVLDSRVLIVVVVPVVVDVRVGTLAKRGCTVT